MRIKTPTSIGSIRSLFKLLGDLRSRVEICSRVRHRTVTILYVSTYTLNVHVTFNRVSLLDLVDDIIAHSPDSVICVFRTVSPFVFSGSISSRHYRMLRELERVGCYVRDFDPRHEEFINHAKFAIAMHYCFDERIKYYGHYYGSTNLTVSGLTNTGYLQLKKSRKFKQIMGNYEEYKCLDLSADYFYSYANHSLRILKDIEEVLEWYLIKTDRGMLTKLLYDQLYWIKELTRVLSEMIRNTSPADIVKAYLFSSIAIYMSMSFIGSLPGKKLTRDIIGRIWSLARDIRLESILELDQILLNDEALKYNEEILFEFLGYSKEELFHRVLNRIELLRFIFNEIESYAGSISELESFLDIHENEVYRRTKELTIKQLDVIRKLQKELSRGYET